MLYDFDKQLDKGGTNSEKFDRRKQLFGREDVIPLWVADMDFPIAPEIMSAMKDRLEKGVFGYSYKNNSLHDAVIGWIDKRNNWAINPSWLLFTPGVVAGIVYALRAFSNENGGIVIQPPVYPPFSRQTELNGRKVINNPLVFKDGKFEIDFDDLDKKLSEAEIFLFCNPHNPTGRVFSEEELRKVGELCVKNNVLIISDEIHSDLIRKPNKHIHIASLSKEIADHTITLSASGKSFNLSGISASFAIIPNERLRKKFEAEMNKLHIDQGAIFEAAAAEAAYRKGEEWLDQCNAYIAENADYVVDFLVKNIPAIKAYQPEGTYLMWLDFRDLGIPHEEIFKFLVNEAHLGLSNGEHFGHEGTGFMRLNIATQKSVIKEAMDNLLSAYQRNF